VYADSPKEPYPYVSVSIDGRYYFKMLPDPEDPWGNNSSGVMYEVSPSGNDKVLWSVSGWYAHATYVSYDGKYLVRLGGWRVWPPKGDLAIAFYENGRLLKRYDTVDVVNDVTKFRRGISYYEYLKGVGGFNGYTHKFTLTTVEDIEYTFDATDGKVVAKNRLRH
jgi:hypothetical protein